MNEEKQIKEMAKILNYCCNEYDENGRHIRNKCNSYDCEYWSEDNFCCCSNGQKEAEALYNAGYRKQSDDEMFRALDCFKKAIVDAFLSLCNYNDYNKINLLLICNTIDRIYNDVVSKMRYF